MQTTLPIVLMTRPDAGTQSFLRACAAADVGGFRPVVSPVLRIEPTGGTPDLTGVQAVIFTSRNGVAFGGAGYGLPAFCVGQRTTQAAKDAGWDAQFTGDTAEDLVRNLTRHPPSGPILHISGVHKRGNLAAALSRVGVQTRAVDVYDQVPVLLTKEAQACLVGGNPVIVPLFSPRSAGQFGKQAKPKADLHILALSDAVMAEVEAVSATSRQVALAPNAASMVEALGKLLLRVEARGTAK